MSATPRIIATPQTAAPTFGSPAAGRPAVRTIGDDAGLWLQARLVLGDQVTVSDHPGPEVIALLTWECGSVSEVASLKAIREEHPGPIVALLKQMPTARGCRAVSALLEGSVLAEQLETALLPTLVAVGAGQNVVPRTVQRLLDRPALSARERQILAMVVLDFPNAEIARRLVVTESNVKSHLTSAFQKLGVSSRTEATELILDHESGLGTGVLRILPGD